MKNKMSNGAKSSAVYIIASLLSKGLAIITMPIFTRIMSSSEIGVVNLYNSWHSMVAVVVSLSLTSGGFQLAMKEFRNDRDGYISSVFCLTSIVAIVAGAVYLVAPQIWNGITGLPSSLMTLMIFHLLLSPAYDFWLMRQRYEYRYLSAGFLSICSAILAAAVSVYAVISASNNGVQSLGQVRLISNYVVQLSIAFVIGIFIIIKGKTGYSKKYWIFSLRLSIPLMGNAFASQVLSVSDRVMIGRMVGNNAVGIYSTLYTVSSLSLLVWNAINASFIPFLFDNMDNPKSNKKIKSISNVLLFAFAVVALFMTIVAPEIVRTLATDEYYEAIYIMPPIAAGVFLTSVTNMYSNILIYHKKTQYIMISTCFAAGVNVVLNYYGIQKLGYMAAAYTTLFAYIIHALIQGVVATKVHASVTRDNNEPVYSTSTIILLAVMTIFGCLCCLSLYRNTFVRYLIIAVISISALVFRKRLLDLVKPERGGRR